MNEKEYLGRVRDRTSAKILGYKDKECNRYLPQDVADGLRKEILDAVNGFCTAAFDLLDSTTVSNELYLDQIAEIHKAVVIDGGSG